MIHVVNYILAKCIKFADLNHNRFTSVYSLLSLVPFFSSKQTVLCRKKVSVEAASWLYQSTSMSIVFKQNVILWHQSGKDWIIFETDWK